MIPECKNSDSGQCKHQLINDRNRHQDNRAVRQPVSVFFHIIKLHWLSACCGRRDSGIKKSDKRIRNTAENSGSFVWQPTLFMDRCQQIPDHHALRRHEKGSANCRCRKIPRAHPCQCRIDIRKLCISKKGEKCQNHHCEEKQNRYSHMLRCCLFPLTLHKVLHATFLLHCRIPRACPQRFSFYTGIP